MPKNGEIDMKITKQNGPPKDILKFDNLEVENDLNLTPGNIEDVIEIFNTPLTGAYNWDYTVSDNRIKKLYELGKELNWNGSMDLNWDYNHPSDERIMQADEDLPHETLEAYESLSDEEKIEFDRHDAAELLSQFLHGEQGALLVASQLTSCAPTYNAKLYAASQTFDEARHVEVFNRYLQEKIGMHYPINKNLKMLLDKILTDERWDLKLIGMQIIIEGLALAAFNTAKAVTPDPVLRDILHLIIRDEARHVTFGVNYLEDFIENLTEEEREDRAMFAYEACVISKERLFPTDVFRRFGWNEDEAREFSNDAGFSLEFQRLLFSRVVPNLSRIGLLTDKVRPLYDQLGVLEFESHTSDDISWAELEKPIDLSA
jgi:hypothetical protein